MKVTESQARKIRITEIPNLDPICCYLEDFGEGRGKITIEVFGKSWSHGWTSMGGRTLIDFFVGCDNYYLTSKFAPMMQSKVTSDDVDLLIKSAKETVISQRKEEYLSSKEARRKYDLAETIDYLDYDALSDIFGDDFWYDLPEEDNHEYQYLCRILDVVREAFTKELKNEKALSQA
jgi:hypothetical protein